MNILYIPSYNKKTPLDIFFQETYPETLTCKSPDFILVSGGDGSMLHAIQDYIHLNVPFFGIAAGTLNFLMNRIEDPTFINPFLSEQDKLTNEEKEVFSSLKNISKFLLNLEIIRANLLNLKIKRQKSNSEWYTVFKAFAANDIVIGESVMDYNEFVVTRKPILTMEDQNVDYKTFSFKGMALCVSTPLGSTAFHYNNGGSIIKNLDKKEIAISSVVSERSKSFHEQFVLKNKLTVQLMSKRNEAAVYIDGKTKVFKINGNDKIIIQQGNEVKLAFINSNDFLEKRQNIEN